MIKEVLILDLSRIKCQRSFDLKTLYYVIAMSKSIRKGQPQQQVEKTKNTWILFSYWRVVNEHVCHIHKHKDKSNSLYWHVLLDTEPASCKSEVHSSPYLTFGTWVNSVTIQLGVLSIIRNICVNNSIAFFIIININFYSYPVLTNWHLMLWY